MSVSFSFDIRCIKWLYVAILAYFKQVYNSHESQGFSEIWPVIAWK